jgi:integral membrane protein
VLSLQKNISKHNIMKTPISRLRTIGIYEGISYLLLLGIAMPLKYLADMPLMVKYTGWAHGVLFVLYMLSVVEVTLAHNWSIKKIAAAVVASLLPFGPFVLDKKLLKEEEIKEEKPAKQVA